MWVQGNIDGNETISDLVMESGYRDYITSCPIIDRAVENMKNTPAMCGIHHYLHRGLQVHGWVAYYQIQVEHIKTVVLREMRSKADGALTLRELYDMAMRELNEVPAMRSLVLTYTEGVLLDYPYKESAWYTVVGGIMAAVSAVRKGIYE